MGLWITTRSQANRHAVYAEERAAPLAIAAEGTGTAALVGQFPWGADDEVIEPTDGGDRVLLMAPPGMPRTGSAYLAMAGKGWPDLRLVRVLGTEAAKAFGNLTSSAGAVINGIVTLKCKGVEGNAVTHTVKAASDGDANHFDLDVTVTGASGFTTDTFQNINFSGVGTASLVDCAMSRLVGSIVVSVAGRPTDGTYTSTGGVTGIINAARYMGTPESGDHGIALLEGSPDVDVVFVDDPGNTDRAAVNAGLKAHQLLMGDRIVVINGNSASTVAAARTASNLMQGGGVFSVDPWHFQRDDVDSTQRLVPPACLLASVICNLPPSTSAAWKGQAVRDMLACVTKLEAARGAAAGGNTAAGICTLIAEARGGYTFEAFVNTAAPAAPTKKRGTRTRMGIYIAKSITQSLRESVDAPNVPLLQNDVIKAIAVFMAGLADNATLNPLGLAHVAAWSWGDLAAVNTQADIAAGDFTIPLNVRTTSGMERIFLSVQYGENVTIQAA